jgi:hypothetical protein
MGVQGVESEGGFRQNILERLGNAHLEDSAVGSQPEDMYSGEFASAAKHNDQSSLQQMK